MAKDTSIYDKYGQKVETVITKQVEEKRAERKEEKNEFLEKMQKIFNVKNNFAFIAVVIIILALAVYLRSAMLRFDSLFEPDGLFYYSVIRATINNHLVVPHNLSISGFPQHNPVNEVPGLIYITVLFYEMLAPLGYSYLTVMRVLPILFGVLETIGAYYLVRSLAKSRVLGLLAMFFVAISSGNIARTSALVYRGDTFVSLFLVVALIFMLKTLNEKDYNKKYYHVAIAAFFLSLGSVVWLGSPFIIAVYMFTLLLFLVYGFMTANTELLRDNLLLTVGLFLTYLLEFLWATVGISRWGLNLEGTSFFVFYLPLLLGGAFAYYFVRKRETYKMFATIQSRTLIFLGLTFFMLIVMFGFFGSYIETIAVIGTGNAPSNTLSSAQEQLNRAIVATTQELQKPSFDFLFSSFNIQLYPFAPIGLFLFLFFAHRISDESKKGIKLNFVPDFLILFSYLAITSYLQASAIRFNSLVSIPIALFAAYGVYGAGKLMHRLRIEDRLAILVPAVIFDVVIAYIFLYQVTPLIQSGIVFIVLSAILINGLLAYVFLYHIYALAKKSFKAKYVYSGFILAMLLFNFYNSWGASFSATQADGINPYFLQAMQWMRNNTPSNATVLALWPDGSVVEGWANRTSYMDSVGGENGTRIYYFARYIFNSSTDEKYLYSIGRPQYLVARGFWFAELGGIATEGLLQNATNFGYVVLNIINSTRNNTAQFFIFSSTAPPFYKAELIVLPQANGTQKFAAAIGTSASPTFNFIKSILFYNTTTGNYTTITSSNPNALNYTLLVSFSGKVINQGSILGGGLPNANLFKFVFTCNRYVCPYNNQNVTLTLQYANSDTRIYKINYLR